MTSGYLPAEIHLPEPTKALMVYRMLLATKGTSIAQSELVRITFHINDSAVYIESASTKSKPQKQIERISK